MLHAIVKYIPLLNSAASFPLVVCRRAATELLIVWTLSSLPLLVSIAAKLFANKSFTDIAAEEVNVKAIFLYTSAFLAPVLYLLIERLVYPKKQKIFRGAQLVFVGTLMIFCFSCWLFQNDKVPDGKSARIVAYSMYGISIYFWWLAIADGRNSEFPYETEVTKDENDFATMAAQKRAGATDGN